MGYPPRRSDKLGVVIRIASALMGAFWLYVLWQETKLYPITNEWSSIKISHVMYLGMAFLCLFIPTIWEREKKRRQKELEEDQNDPCRLRYIIH